MGFLIIQLRDRPKDNWYYPFENTDINKYVDLEKSLLMKCVYVKRFKKWQPLSVFINDNNDMPIFTYNEIKKREY